MLGLSAIKEEPSLPVNKPALQLVEDWLSARYDYLTESMQDVIKPGPGGNSDEDEQQQQEQEAPDMDAVGTSGRDLPLQVHASAEVRAAP